MNKEPINNLTEAMQERLDKWRKYTLPTKNPNPFRSVSPGNYVGRRRDYGDDMEEFNPREIKND